MNPAAISGQAAFTQTMVTSAPHAGQQVVCKATHTVVPHISQAHITQTAGLSCEHTVLDAYHPKTTSQEQKSSGMPIAVERLDCM